MDLLIQDIPQLVEVLIQHVLQETSNLQHFQLLVNLVEKVIIVQMQE